MIKARYSLLFTDSGSVRLGINTGLEKILMEPNTDIECITKPFDQNQRLGSIDTGIQIVCPETSLDIVKAKCFGLLDASVIVPIA
jgi:hypothetical protein